MMNFSKKYYIIRNLEYNKYLKFIAKAIGYVITIASFIYIINQLLTLKINVTTHTKSFLFYLYIAVFSFLHTTTIFAAALAWKIIIEFLENKIIPLKIILQVYLRSNIAKYLPGNVFHYIGRNYLGSKLGMKHSAIGISSGFEIAFVVITTGILTIISFLINKNPLPKEIILKIKSNYGIIFSILGIIFIIICLLLIKKNYLIKIAMRFFSKRFIALLVKAIILESFTFIFSGLILASIYIFIFNSAISSKVIITVIYFFIISSFLGYITPGAPGGIGVREASLILMLSPVLGKESILMASIILRLVTTLSDVIAFLLGYFLSLKNTER